MRRSVLLAGLGLAAFFAAGMLLVYWQTQPSEPAPSAPAVAEAPDSPAPVAAPPSLPEPPPGAPAVRVAIPAGPLQARLESADPEERTEALVDAREQRRGRMMDWLNRNANRKAAAAGTSPAPPPPGPTGPPPRANPRPTAPSGQR